MLAITWHAPTAERLKLWLLSDLHNCLFVNESHLHV